MINKYKQEKNNGNKELLSFCIECSTIHELGCEFKIKWIEEYLISILIKMHLIPKETHTDESKDKYSEKE